MDNTLPGQLLQVRKIDYYCGLIYIVISSYNWKKIHENVSGSQENLTSKKICIDQQSSFL